MSAATWILVQAISVFSIRTCTKIQFALRFLMKSFTVQSIDLIQKSFDVSIDGPWQIQPAALSRDECEAGPQPQQWCSRLGSWSNLQDNFFDNLTVSLEIAAACQQNSLYFLPNDYTCCHNKIEIKISKLESKQKHSVFNFVHVTYSWSFTVQYEAAQFICILYLCYLKLYPFIYNAGDFMIRI